MKSFYLLHMWHVEVCQTSTITLLTPSQQQLFTCCIAALPFYLLHTSVLVQSEDYSNFLIWNGYVPGDIQFRDPLLGNGGSPRKALFPLPPKTLDSLCWLAINCAFGFLPGWTSTASGESKLTKEAKRATFSACVLSPPELGGTLLALQRLGSSSSPSMNVLSRFQVLETCNTR